MASPIYDTPPGVGGKIDTNTGAVISGPLAGSPAGTDQGSRYTPPGTSPTPAPRYPSGSPVSSTSRTTPADTAETTYVNSTTPEDPAAVTSRIQSEFSGEIQAIKDYYRQLTSQQQIINTNESGKARARVAAEGELGMDIGSAEQQAQEKTNRSALEDIATKENAAISAVESNASSQAESEIAKEKSTYQSALAGDVTYQSQRSQQAEARVKSVAAAYDLASVPQGTYDQLYEASGFTTPEEFNAYYNASRVSAMTGGKTIGDATTGVWQQQMDGSWKIIVPGAKTIGDPTSGVWQLQEDGSYKNIIPAQLKVGSIGTRGSYVFNPNTGQVETVGGVTSNRIVSSGGVIYSVDPNTNKATPLTKSGGGWASSSGSSSTEKAAIMSYLNTLRATPGFDYDATLKKIQDDPTTYYQALGSSMDAGIYTPTAAAGATPSDQAASDAAINAAQAAQDAADSAASVNAGG